MSNPAPNSIRRSRQANPQKVDVHGVSDATERDPLSRGVWTPASSTPANQQVCTTLTPQPCNSMRAAYRRPHVNHAAPSVIRPRNTRPTKEVLSPHGSGQYRRALRYPPSSRSIPATASAVNNRLRACDLRCRPRIVHGHEKVPTGGRVTVPTGGQMKVPASCSS